MSDETARDESAETSVFAEATGVSPESEAAEEVTGSTGEESAGAADVAKDEFEPVEQVAFHDFASYYYVLDPWAQPDLGNTDIDKPTKMPVETTEPPPVQSYMPVDLSEFESIDSEARDMIRGFLEDLRTSLYDPATFDASLITELIFRFRTKCMWSLVSHYIPEQAPCRANQMLFHWLEYGLAELYEPYSKLTGAERQSFYTDALYPAIEQWAKRAAVFDMPWRFESVYGGHAEFSRYNRQNLVELDIPEADRVRGNCFQPISLALNLEGEFGVGAMAHVAAWHTGLGDTETWRPNKTRRDLGNLDQQDVYFTTNDFYTGVYIDPSKNSTVIDAVNKILASRPTDVLLQAEREAMETAIDSIFKQYSVLFTEDESAEPSEIPRRTYGFEPYPEGSFNVGLRVIYRQEWRPLGTQPGELVRTLPLGPGQTERITTKVLRREKLTSLTEEATEAEYREEKTRTSTTSRELVEEAASANKWHLDTGSEGQFTMGAWSVKANNSAGFARETSQTSRESKKRLSESMHKAASLSRRKSKVQVSTESEIRFEEERFTEIQNENQEIAVTYQYETLQRQYEVKSLLAEIQPVIFIAEHVPKPHALNIRWMRRYDWILSRVLLDESYRSTLNLISSQDPQDIADLDLATLGLDEVKTLGAAVTAASKSLEQIQNLSGDVANTYEATLKAYQEAVQRSHQLIAEKRNLFYQIDRFRQHVADNILHYCRAIWTREDPERRGMRYGSVSIPVQFESALDYEGGEADPEDPGMWLYDGTWVPVKWASLFEVIDPAGPIGFAGNYAIYRLKKTQMSVGLTPLIRRAALPYYEPTQFIVSQERISGDIDYDVVNIEVSLVNQDFYPGASYCLAFDGSAWKLLKRQYDGTFRNLTAVASITADTASGGIVLHRVFSFEGLRVAIKKRPDGPVHLWIVPKEPVVMDPELAYMREQKPTTDLADLKEELERQNTDRILVDTTNLHLNLLRGTGTVLEKFKQDHRELDVKLVEQELLRRKRRIDAGDFDDPDIDKVVMIDHSKPGPGAEAAISYTEALVPGDVE